MRRVETRRDQKLFLRVPWSLYADDAAWVPPLQTLLRDRFCTRRNPYFQHADVVCFLAERDGKVVGRISAQVCDLVQSHHDPGTGHYGSFECENRVQPARALFDAAERWLKERGMTRIVGPFDLSINDEAGMLVEGFDDPPYVMMGHHCSYYTELLENLGLQKEMDLIAYFLDISQPYSRRIARLIQRASKDARISIRDLEKKHYDSGLHEVFQIFKESWIDNWGYIPPTDAESDHLVRQTRRLLDRGSVVLAEFEGELAGFMITLPNLNEFIKDLNGRLFPTGWMRLLWRLRVAPFKSVRVPLMGVRKKYQGTHVGASISILMIDHCRAKLLPRGVTDCEMSWILESNTPMRSILDAAGCEPYKRYRIFAKSI